jgi:hypothetical protein
MIIQINPPLPIWSEKYGNGLAHFVIDYGIESHLYWVVFLDSDGSCRTLQNPEVRMQFNETAGRNNKNLVFTPPALKAW